MMQKTCDKILKCGHPCGGSVGEKECMPCLEEECINKLPENKKSYGLSLNISSNEKTLSDKEIDNLMLKITKNLNLNFGAELRN